MSNVDELLKFGQKFSNLGSTIQDQVVYVIESYMNGNTPDDAMINTSALDRAKDMLRGTLISDDLEEAISWYMDQPRGHYDESKKIKTEATLLGSNANFPVLGEGAPTLEALVRRCNAWAGVMIKGEVPVVGVFDPIMAQWETYKWLSEKSCFTFVGYLSNIPDAIPFAIPRNTTVNTGQNIQFFV